MANRTELTIDLSMGLQIPNWPLDLIDEDNVILNWQQGK